MATLDLGEHFDAVRVRQYASLEMPAVAGLMRLLPLRAAAAFLETPLPPVPRRAARIPPIQ